MQIRLHLPDDRTLANKRRADATRPRHNFDLHRRLSDPLLEWYSALNDLEPGRVIWHFPEDLPAAPTRNRYDLALFDAWMLELSAGKDAS